MTDRIGICVGCGTRFKVPASFKGRSANCRKCGKSVRIESVAAAPSVGSPAKSPRAAVESNPRSTSPTDDSSLGSTLAFALGCVLVLGGGGYYAWLTLRDARSFEDEEALAAGTATPSHPRPSRVPVANVPKEPVTTPDATPSDRVIANPSESPVILLEPELPTVISFTRLTRPTDCAETIWTGFERTVKDAFRSTQASEGSRVAARDSWSKHRVAALCALLNGLDGLDLEKPTDATNARRLLEEIAAATFDLIRLPPRAQSDDPVADARYEAKLVNQLIRYWSERMRTPEVVSAELNAAEARAKQRDF